MNAALLFGRCSRYAVLPLAAFLALVGCGSGGEADTTQATPVAYAYVTSAATSPGNPGAVYEYAIMNDSSVSPLAQASVGAGINPSTLVVFQEYVYVVNLGDGTISQYNIGSDETLSPMNPAAVRNPGMHTLGVAGGAAAVDPTGSFLYVANTADDTVSQFAIGNDGRLTALTPSTVANGVGAASIVTGTPGIYVVNSGVPGDAGSVSQYSEASNGGLTPANDAPVPAGTNPSGMAVNTAFSTAYVLSNCDGAQCVGSIRQFTVGADGALTDTGTIASTGSHYRAASMVLDPSGANGYVLTNEMGVDTQSGALWHFQVGSTGALTADSSSPLSIAELALAQSIQAGSLFVLTTNSGVNANSAATGGSIIAYSLGTGGAPTLEATTKLEAPYPASMAVRVLLAP
jgi:6-phosphogluconolactonase (cycloisomerase 2 family)